MCSIVSRFTQDSEGARGALLVGFVCVRLPYQCSLRPYLLPVRPCFIGCVAGANLGGKNLKLQKGGAKKPRACLWEQSDGS